MKGSGFFRARRRLLRRFLRWARSLERDGRLIDARCRIWQRYAVNRRVSWSCSDVAPACAEAEEARLERALVRIARLQAGQPAFGVHCMEWWGGSR
jgi:hypothetical protein